MSAPPPLATLTKLSPTGTPASLRVMLPPNLATAATRDAIAVRFEITVQGRGQFPAGMAPDDRALNVPAPQLSALFLIESWNQGRAATMAQLTRAQLAALLAVLQGEPPSTPMLAFMDVIRRLAEQGSGTARGAQAAPVAQA